VAKHCTNCGHELREGDKFCAECGASAGQATTPQQAPVYETCEIKWRRTMSWPVFRFAFVAEAIGPQGMYSAGQSDSVTGPASPERGAGAARGKAVLNALIARLTSEGWESVSTKGPEWYSYRFRRQVRR
jgi:zinc-ribbon domain